VSDPDLLIVGLGWAGGILAAEATAAGLSVLALERGHALSQAELDTARDELKVRRHTFMQDVSQETWTLRHHAGEQALPLRRLGAWTPGSGVGGSSLLYGGLLKRYYPADFRPRRDLVGEYGPAVVPPGAALPDWGLGYDDLEPYYQRVEEVAGVAGGANPFAGPRSGPFPVPPRTGSRYRVFADAARTLGLHPFDVPTTALPADFTNPDGITRPHCRECGFCVGLPCAVHAKGEAASTVIPAALRTGRLRIRENCYVVGVLTEGRRVTGVRYHDETGTLRFQRADRVALCSYAFGNTRLLLLSGIGTPYDQGNHRGSVGRNYSTNISMRLTALFADRTFANHIGSVESGGFEVDDFIGDRTDPRAAGYLGGFDISAGPSGRGGVMSRLVTPPGTPRWGTAWKTAVRDWFDHDLKLSGHGQVLPYEDSYLDLDPVYRDRHGHPLLRITFDWHDNERRLARAMSEKMREIGQAMGATTLSGPAGLDRHYDTARYQGTHNTGGAIMGDDPDTSVVGPWLREWTHDNLWVVGGSALPRGSSAGPTATICALAFRAAEDIVRNG
jgi:gluconate 2-dehydrogenase alpha chain